MKICYLCPDLGISTEGTKGASSHIRGFVGALKDCGHSVDIVSSTGGDFPIPKPPFLSYLPKENEPRVYRALTHLFYNSAIENYLSNYIEKEKPDLIYERYSPFSAAGGITAKRFGVPHLLEINAPLAEQGKLYRKQALQEAAELMEESALKNAGGFVVLTDELKTWLLEKGHSDRPIFLKPCAVDHEMFCPEGEKISFPGKKVIGFVGSLKPWHDIELILETFQLLKEDERIHLLIVGDGPMRDVVQKFSLQYPGRITLTGAIAQEEIPAYIRAMDVPLAPYPKMELFYFSPLKIFEYMACGKACVATGIGQINSLVSHGKTGMIVKPHDETELAEAIKTLINDPVLSQNLGSAARTSVCKEHTWEKRTQNWLKDVEKFI